jgi:hypothetical protein
MIPTTLDKIITQTIPHDVEIMESMETGTITQSVLKMKGQRARIDARRDLAGPVPQLVQRDDLTSFIILCLIHHMRLWDMMRSSPGLHDME